MGLLKVDVYYLKALDCYPYCIEEVVENLDYALAIDAEHVGANYLLGRLYAECFKDLNKAEKYFVKALSNNAYHIETTQHYAVLLIHKREFAKARKVLKFAKNINGVDLGSIYHTIAYCYEVEKEYKKALKALKQAKINGYNEAFLLHLSVL